MVTYAAWKAADNAHMQQSVYRWARQPSLPGSIVVHAAGGPGSVTKISMSSKSVTMGFSSTWSVDVVDPACVENSRGDGSKLPSGKREDCGKCVLSALCLPRGVGVVAEQHWRCGRCGGLFRCSDEWGDGAWLEPREVCTRLTHIIDMWNAIGCCAPCKKEAANEARMKKERKLRWRHENKTVPKV